METALQLAQIIFYIAIGFVAVLTYLKAKNGLLNTINTEYHKKVIERLYQVNDDFYAEFDRSSDRAWFKEDSTRELIERINELARDVKHELLTEGPSALPGIPVTKKESELRNLADKYRSDPFLPKLLREEIVQLLDGRWEALHEASVEAAEFYKLELSQHRRWDTLDTNHHWIHNRINDSLYSSGWGISQVEEKTNLLRLHIQEYFESFNPIRT
jgi:hypothetical protein